MLQNSAIRKALTVLTTCTSGHAGPLTPSTCLVNPSDAGSAHDNGAVDDGTTSMASGTTCTSTRSGGYTASGTAASDAGTNTPATAR